MTWRVDGCGRYDLGGGRGGEYDLEGGREGESMNWRVNGG